MPTWLFITDLVRDLGLKARPDDPDALRDEIRREIAAIHPDRHGGTFAKPDDQPRYQRLLEGLEFLDRPPSTALVPIQDIPALVAAIKQALGPPEKTQTPLEARAEFREIARTELHQRLFLPRIGSGVFAAMCAFLFSVGEKFKEDPLVGLWVQSRTGKLMIFMSMLYSALFFAMTWWMEQTASARAEWLATEDGRRHLCAKLLHEVPPHLSSPEDPKAFCFSFSDLVRVIRGQARHGLPLPFLPRGLSGAAAEKLARAHLDELEARGVVQRLPGKRLDVLYKMDTDAAEEMRHGFHEWT